MVTSDWVKPGATVIDVGVNRVNDDSERGYHLTGDVHPDVGEVAGALSPVPGGVGHDDCHADVEYGSSD